MTHATPAQVQVCQKLSPRAASHKLATILTSVLSAGIPSQEVALSAGWPSEGGQAAQTCFKLRVSATGCTSRVSTLGVCHFVSICADELHQECCNTDDRPKMCPHGASSSVGCILSVCKISSRISPGSRISGLVDQKSTKLGKSTTLGHLPASFTGVVGLKPSYGRISRWGVIEFASSLDHVGIFTRSVEDAAIVLSSIQGFDNQDSTSYKSPYNENFALGLDNSINQIKVGRIKELEKFAVSSCVQHVCEEFYKNLQKLGAEIVEISLPNIEDSLTAYYIISCCEASSNLARYDGKLAPPMLRSDSGL